MKYIILILLLQVVNNLSAQKIHTEQVSCLSDSILLKGVLSYPETDEKLPAVIIISGTGRQDRDGSFGEHNPFKEIADYLNGLGYAVLRMDDRGVRESEGVYEDATTMDFVADVNVEIELLKQNPKIDKKKIGLVGHSEGGAVAFILASTSKDVKFIVSLAGLAVDGYTSLILQNKRVLESNEFIKPQYVDIYMSLYACMFTTVKSTPLQNDVETRIDSAFQIWKAKQTDENLTAVQLNDGRDQNFLYRFKKLAIRPWYRQLLQYNPDKYISKIKIPVLALNGDKDIMVTPEENLNNIDRLLTKAGNKNFQTVLLQNHNHMFQHCKECTQNEMVNLSEAISIETLEIIGNWLKVINQ